MAKEYSPDVVAQRYEIFQHFATQEMLLVSDENRFTSDIELMAKCIFTTKFLCN